MKEYDTHCYDVDLSWIIKLIEETKNNNTCRQKNNHNHNNTGSDYNDDNDNNNDDNKNNNDNNSNENKKIDRYYRSHALQAACKYGSIGIVQGLIENGICDDGIIDMVDNWQSGSTPLTKACQYGYLDIVQCLVENGKADINKKSEEGSNAIDNAINYGHFPIIKYLVETCDIDLNAFHSYGKTCLHTAIENDRLDFVEYLILHGAKINAAKKYSYYYQSPIDFAYNSRKNGGTSSSLETVTFMFETWAKVKNSGHDLLKTAIEKGFWDIAANLVIRDKVIDIDATDECSGQTLLFDLSSQPKQSTQSIHWLLNMGANVNTKNKHGLTPLHEACKAGVLQNVQLLCEYGADIHAQNDMRQTPLHVALASNGNRDPTVALHLLEEQGANGNIQDNNGLTPLHYAYQYNEPIVFRYMLKNGADVSIRDSSGKVPEYAGLLCVCCELGLFDNVKCLVENKTGACVHGQRSNQKSDNLLNIPPSTGVLLHSTTNEDNERNVNVTCKGETPLHYACRGGFVDIVDYLLLHGAYLEAGNNDYQTPLHLSIQNTDQRFSQWLLVEKGANGNATDKFGRTPLHYACGYGRSLVVECLLQMGYVDVEAKTIAKVKAFCDYKYHRECATPLHYACGFTAKQVIKDQITILKQLIAFGVNLTARDFSSNTPLHYAMRSNFLEGAVALLEAGGPEMLHVCGIGGNDAKRTFWFGMEYRMLVGVAKRCPVYIHIFPKNYKFAVDLLEENPELLKRVTFSKTGNLPLHDACKYGSDRDMIEYMIAVYPGALHQRNAMGRLPFHEACCGSGGGSGKDISLQVVSMLFQLHPAAVSDVDGSGKLPFELAIENDAPLDVIYFLLSEFPESLQQLIDRV